MMSFVLSTLFLLLVAAGCSIVVVVVEATPSPVHAPQAAAAAASSTSSLSSSSSSNSIFGISKRLPAVLSVRGGKVLEPESLADVESILTKAGSERKLVVIDFSATWCGPCKMIAPLFKELSEAISDVVFLKIDVDENPDTAAKYNVSAMPTFLFIKAGEVVDRLMGANPTRLQELIDEHK